MALDKQYCIYGVDTSAFYFDDEKCLEEKICKLRTFKIRLKKEINELTDNDCVRFVLESKYKEISKNLASLKSKFIDMLKCNMCFTRRSSENKFHEKNRISVFSSDLTRCLNMKPLNLDVRQTVENTVVNEEMIIVSVFYFEVLESLLKNGFLHRGKKYVYFASSAGQIRTKKAVFVREDLLKSVMNTLTCGLSVDEVNEKGGMNLNKFNAYLALSNSATEVWEDFDIDRCIVVNDFETNITAEVDYVDDKDYSITRRTMPVLIPHTDGAGMISPELSSKNFMVRMPWLKGLLGVFPFKDFIIENKCSSKIKDVWGKEWDIISDNIQIIFTASQLKMHKFYDSWDDYKSRFKKYNCHAGKCNVEENKFKRASINYQAIQSFVEYSDKELQSMCKDSVEFINGICQDKNIQLELFGITENNSFEKYNGMQKCLLEYNGLIKDSYFQEQLKDRRKKLIKDLYSAKFRVNGYYTFLLPDFYAFCEWLFMEKKCPEGLLSKKEIHCKLHDFNKEVDCLRSPHLYFEHSIQKNVTSPEIEKWFLTNGCYTSTFDTITKELMNDVDGDKTLIIQDDVIINAAKRNQTNIVPLYYNMRKAENQLINNESRFKGLITAFTGGNIGIYSNDISKIKNSEEIRNNATKQEALDCIRWLCMQNNEVIDFAKTLYKSEPPRSVKKIISKYTNKKLPHFFIYSKDKSESQVEEINDCIVNRIFTLYPEHKFKFKFTDKKRFDYRMLMSNPDIVTDKNVLNLYSDAVSTIKLKINKENKKLKPIINDVIVHMQQCGYSQIEVCDMLIKDMFKDHNVFKNDRRKEIFFQIYGDIIYDNIIHNKLKYGYICVDCGEELRKTRGRQRRCEKCQKKYRTKYQKELMQKRRLVSK